MSMIQWQGLSLVFPHKTCFSEFSGQLDWGCRIAIVGDNGSGKSSLLRMLAGLQSPSEGRLQMEPLLRLGHVPQVLDGDLKLSGGQRVNQALSQALAEQPDLLLLDEPSNHLDTANRRAMLRMLQHFHGGLLLVTHDETWMNTLCDTLWIVADGQIRVFHGRYQDYLAERAGQHAALQRQRDLLRREQQGAHQRLMQEQQRASHARQRGEKAIRERRWATVKSATKLGRGNTTAVDNRADLLTRQQTLGDELARLSPGEVISPAFFLPPQARHARGPVVQVSDGLIGHERVIAGPLHLVIRSGERWLLGGANGSGKSTLARALLGETALRLGGQWQTPPRQEIGYLDQHYANLPADQTVLAVLQQTVPDWAPSALRHHLSRFLFRGDGAVQTLVRALSGGERARLSLACLAARPPQLLILDEISNNLDGRARQHVASILHDYPGTLLLISHDEALVQQLGEMRRLNL
ncbi:ATP-binding cassette domain-containing protein [Paludibacterium sp. THUN1379]|uniref:ATP-binding cassette domain-containing protein n=1 Tax=Paludibacterium sp. THUN1379 TaxID=3112107 RepID=UPI0030CDDBC9